MSLLQPGSSTYDVAATFTSHAAGERGQHVIEILPTNEEVTQLTMDAARCAFAAEVL